MKDLRGVHTDDSVCEACGGPPEHMPHAIGSPVCVGMLEKKGTAVADEIVALRAALRASIRYATHGKGCNLVPCSCGYIEWREARERAMRR